MEDGESNERERSLNLFYKMLCGRPMDDGRVCVCSFVIWFPQANDESHKTTTYLENGSNLHLHVTSSTKFIFFVRLIFVGDDNIIVNVNKKDHIFKYTHLDAWRDKPHGNRVHHCRPHDFLAIKCCKKCLRLCRHVSASASVSEWVCVCVF